MYSEKLCRSYKTNVSKSYLTNKKIYLRKSLKVYIFNFANSFSTKSSLISSFLEEASALTLFMPDN